MFITQRLKSRDLNRCNKLKDELVPLLDDTSDDCRKIFGEALDKALSRLVNFKDLLQSLKSRC